MAKLLQNAASTRKRIREESGEDKHEFSILENIPPTTTSDKPEKKSKVVRTSASSSESKIIYLGHIPHGFYEKEMRKFFTQYGKVERLKLFRSKKTGRSKGYAFIEFESADIAKVVAESMQGYFIFEKQLVSHVVPLEKHHDGMFKSFKNKKIQVIDKKE